MILSSKVVGSGGVPGGGASDLVWECMMGSGNGVDDHGESGDGGGDGMARSLAISASDQTGVGGLSRIDILAVTRYAGCGGGVAADLSVSNDTVSSADGA
ncbi:hypothetical protein Tco_0698328 [Tanacetum coccineum]